MSLTSTPNILALLSILLGLLGLALLIATAVALRHGHMLRAVYRLALSTALIGLGSLFATIVAGTIGYHALTHEDLAATVEVQPLGPQTFRAIIHLPDGQITTQTIDGDEFYVDAHILKWKPIGNIMGLHTVYSLDRFGGRYLSLTDERSAPRTVYGLKQDRPFDLFDLRRRYKMLAPLVDAEYGSASFITVDRPQELEVRVSTTGLLIRVQRSRSE